MVKKETLMELSKEVVQCIDDSREELISLLKELAVIPAPSHNEDLRAAFCKEWLEENGAQGVYIDSAKNVINSDNSLTDEQKAAYLERITEEWIAIEYWYVYLFYSQILDSLDGVKVDVATEKAAFRDALGYDSTTGEYAKDVMLLERADITLAQWVESNFSEDLIQ